MNKIVLTNFQINKEILLIRLKNLIDVKYSKYFYLFNGEEEIYPDEIKYDDCGEVILTFPLYNFYRGSEYILYFQGKKAKLINNLSVESHERYKLLLKFFSNNLSLKRMTKREILKYQVNKIFNFKKMRFQRGGKVRLLYWLTKPYFINKRIIIFGERGDSFSDNGSILFFKYFNQKSDDSYFLTEIAHPTKEIKKNKFVKKNSLKHILYFLNSDVCVNAYDIERYMSFGGYGKSGLLQTFGDLLKYKKVFLQHGVFYNDISFYLEKNKANFDLVVVSTRHEFKFLKSIGYLDYEIAESGLPRFINLCDKSNAVDNPIDILIMPTWRSFIKNGNEFIKSNYFKEFIYLCNKISKELPDKRIIFFQHYEFQKYNDHVMNALDSNITLLTGNEKIQTLLTKSKLLITDYSSVMFDFIYMNKPVISFQFDKKEFFSKHTLEPIIDFKEIPLISVKEDVLDVMDEIKIISKKNFKLIKKPHHIFYEINDQSIRNLANKITNL